MKKPFKVADSITAVLSLDVDANIVIVIVIFVCVWAFIDSIEENKNILNCS